MNRYWFLLLAVAPLLASGCSAPDKDDASSDTVPSLATLSGEAFYRERIYVPPGAKLHISLKDVPDAGMPSTVVAKSTILLAGSQPYQFTLDYSPADIDASTQYTLRAEIMFYDDLLFTSAHRVDPFAQTDEKISIQLNAVSSSGE